MLLSLPPSPRIQLPPQMLHLSIPHPFNYVSGISDTMSAEIIQWAAITSASENKGIPFVLCTSFLFSHFLYHHPPLPLSLSLSLPPSTRRPQITTSLRVWSVAGVPHWCWVKVEWFTRREICRLSRAPGDLFPANNSQTTLISALNAGIRYGTHLHNGYVITTVLCFRGRDRFS